MNLTGESARMKEKSIFRHLWNVGLVNEVEYQELLRTGMLREQPSVQIQKSSKRGSINERRRGHGYVNG